jgi:hypothetical protein
MGFAALARRHHLAGWSCHRHFRHHHGCGAPDFGDRFGWPHHGHRDDHGEGDDPIEFGRQGGGLRGGAAPWFLLRRLLRQVEVTPTQERAIRAAVDEFRETLKPLRAEGRRSRGDLAAAMRRTSLDEVALGEMFARHDRAAEELRRALVGLLAKVHEVLDDIQRERLAALLEKGPRGFPFGDRGMADLS